VGGRSRGETRRGATRSHVRCRDIMTRDVTVATRDTTLEEVARLMKNEDTGVIPVVDRADAAASTQPQSALDTTATTATDASANAAHVNAAASHDVRRVNATVHGNGRLVGLITDRDIVVRAIAEGRAAATTRAEEIMTEEVHTAQPNDRVIEAIRKMGDKQVRRIPIVDQDKTLRGIISMADVALETNDDRELAEALEEISSGSSFWNRIFG
jgi:CBS domain-containing protein